MNPHIAEISNENKILTFHIENINVSLINAIRRIILSEIPCVVFRTFPHKKNNAIIDKNTSRFNNEIIKQRLSCIPIHIMDTAFPIQDFVVEIEKKNESDVIEYITTEDFKIKDVNSEKYLSREEVKTIFPPDPITNDYIDVVRIRPRLSKSLDGEALKMTCTFSIADAKENSSFNVASTCTYGAAVDKVELNRIWTEKTKAYKKEGKTEEEVSSIHDDWLLLDAKRIIKPNAFNFIVESVGVFDAMSIVEKACQIMLNKLTKFGKDIQDKEAMIVTSETTIQNCYDIRLEGEDYTLGKVLEYILYATYYEVDDPSQKILTFCGFIKPHPHIDLSIIRLGFTDSTSKDIVISYLMETQTKAVKIYTALKKEFESVD